MIAVMANVKGINTTANINIYVIIQSISHRKSSVANIFFHPSSSSSFLSLVPIDSAMSRLFDSAMPRLTFGVSFSVRGEASVNYNSLHQRGLEK